MPAPAGAGQGSYVPPRTNSGSKAKVSKKKAAKKLVRAAKKEAADLFERIMPLWPWLVGVPAALAIALGLVAAILPGGTLIAASVLAILGILLVVGGYGLGAYVAFSEDSLNGWLFLFIPFYAAYYIVKHFDDMWLCFVPMTAGAVAVFIAGSIALPALEKKQAGAHPTEGRIVRPAGTEMVSSAALSIVHPAMAQVA
jgi:hypothetical protein